MDLGTLQSDPLGFRRFQVCPTKFQGSSREFCGVPVGFKWFLGRFREYQYTLFVTAVYQIGSEPSWSPERSRVDEGPVSVGERRVYYGLYKYLRSKKVYPRNKYTMHITLVRQVVLYAH